MPNHALIAELKAAAASLMTAIGAAEADDWAAAEQAVMDAQDRSSRILREIEIEQRAPTPTPTDSPPQSDD